MAHFAIPSSENASADYHVDNKMCVGSVGGMVVPPGSSAEIVLCCGDDLAVRSNNPNVVRNPIPERPGPGGRVLTIKPAAQGGSYIDFGVLNADGWSWAPGSPWPGHLLVTAGPRATAPVADGLVELDSPSLVLNAADTPVPYALQSTLTVRKATSADVIAGLVTSKGMLKHLVFSCHGSVELSHTKPPSITGSTISIGAGLTRANVQVFERFQRMGGGVIWAGACAIGNDDETNKLRARNSKCYFVAPVMFMQVKPGAKRLPAGRIDMYRRFQPKVFAPTGALVAWDTFVRDYSKRLGFKVVAG